MKSRTAAALVELITACVLLGILCSLCAALLHAEATIARHTSENTALDEAVRATQAILTSEIRSLQRSDIHAVGADSISMRIFRGWGVVCWTYGSVILVEYSGLRQPDPGKDSLLVFGEERVGTFRTEAEPQSHPPCIAESDEQLIAIDPTLPVYRGSVVAFFETGAYHIAQNALRYRRGTEGKQPLTDELLDHRKSSINVELNGRGLGLRVRSLQDQSRVHSAESRIRLLNQPRSSE